MEVMIRGKPEEIAALVLEIQGRHAEGLTEDVVRQIADGFTEAISSVRTP